MVSTSTPASNPTTFICKAGLCRSGNHRGIWIESPRTGRRISFLDGWFGDLPDRIVGRITAQVAIGNNRIQFTRDELKAVADVHARFEFKTTPGADPTINWGDPKRDADVRSWMALCKAEPTPCLRRGLWSGWRRPR